MKKGIYVKIINKEILNGKYFKKNGKIIEVIDKFEAVIKMDESNDIIQIHQKYLQTVLPVNIQNN
jgi:DNA/RNA-binding protein KIN17